MSDDINKLLADLESARREIERLQSEVDRLSDPERLIQDATVRFIDGGGLEFEHWALKLIAMSLGKSFVDCGATNYFDLEMNHPELGWLVVTVQRKAGKTPGAVNNELKAENARLREALRPFALIAATVDALPLPPNPCVGQWLNVQIGNLNLTCVATVDDCRKAREVLNP